MGMNWEAFGQAVGDGLIDVSKYAIRDSFEQRAYERKERLQHQLMLERGEIQQGYNVTNAAIAQQDKLYAQEHTAGLSEEKAVADYGRTLGTEAVKLENSKALEETKGGQDRLTQKVKSEGLLEVAKVESTGKNKKGKGYIPSEVKTKIKGFDKEIEYLKGEVRDIAKYAPAPGDPDYKRLQKSTARIVALQKARALLNKMQDAYAMEDEVKLREAIKEYNDLKTERDAPPPALQAR